jgi:adenylate kinase
MRLVFLGPPASGKGTLSQLLAERVEARVVSTGVMLRRHVSEDTELGQQVAVYLAASRLVPDPLVLKMVDNWLLENPFQPWILDGFPRTLAQAKHLSNILEREGISFDGAVSLEVPQSELERRIQARLQCRACGHTTTLDRNGESNECPKCGAELASRADDDVAKFRNRYQDFLELTMPVIDYYRQRGELITVTAEGDPSTITDTLHKKLAEVS